ncbi:polymer-forming cytoskeletal protein [Pendulispora albinea]|uniref:Polymer-forming cytoskeletal protein n=1 Tax=Pendulispora albinea TaxID=2741071 RepID=A0ABZ2LVS1_9BACT
MAETTVIGRSSHIRGRITGSADLEIAGHVEGTVEIAGELVVTAEGRVAATLSAERVIIRGAVKGDVTATEAIHLEDGARVVGDVRAPRIAIAPGALFRGYVQTAGDQASPNARTRVQPAAVSTPSASRATNNGRPAITPAALTRASTAPTAQVVAARVEVRSPAQQAAARPSAPPARTVPASNHNPSSPPGRATAPAGAKPGPPAPTVPVLKKGARGTLQKKRA